MQGPSRRWTVTMGRPIKDPDGKVRAVLAVGTLLERLQEALRIKSLPRDTVVTVVNQKGIVVTRSFDAVQIIGRDVSHWKNFPRHLGMQEGSQITRWETDGIERITAFAKVHRAPWIVNVGQPTKAAFAVVGSRLAWSALFVLGTLTIGFAIAWILS